MGSREAANIRLASPTHEALAPPLVPDLRVGVFEIYDTDGGLESVFIPGGKSMHLTATPRLHAIWSQ